MPMSLVGLVSTLYHGPVIFLDGNDLCNNSLGSLYQKEIEHNS